MVEKIIGKKFFLIEYYKIQKKYVIKPLYAKKFEYEYNYIPHKYL